MFTESMLENSWGHRSRRGLSTAGSFGLQAIIIGTVILLSLLKSVMLPTAQVVSTPIFVGRAEPAPVAEHSRGGSGASTPHTTSLIQLVQPRVVPNGIHQGPAESPLQPPGTRDGGIYGNGLPSTGPGLPTAFFGGTHPVMPVEAPPAVRQFKTSSMLEGSLIRKVQPIYPPLAKSARIQGPVVLEAVISKAGTIDNLRALSGPPMLVRAAIDAVSQWRYRPYILNGQAIEVETQITVNFTLSGN